MSRRFGVPRSHALALKGGALAAATVLGGAGLLGVATAGQEISAAPFAQVHHSAALVAFPTFSESLQNLLNTMGVGDLNQVLAVFGDVPGTTTPLGVGSDVSALLAVLNPNGVTLGGVANLLGTSLTEPLYSSNAAIDSVLGTGSLLLVNGVPIGNVDLGGVLDAVLGAGAGSHPLTDLANAVGLGSMLSQYGSVINGLGLDNMNIDNCTLNCGQLANITSHPGLTVNSSLDDWLSGILKVPTTDITQHAFSGLGSTTVVPNSAYTLAEYLHTITFNGTSTTMDDATLAQLFGLNPTQTWDQYLDSLPFGGTLLDPSGVTIGEQTLGTFLSSFLPDGSTLAITGDTPITDFLEALGLLTP